MVYSGVEKGVCPEKWTLHVMAKVKHIHKYIRVKITTKFKSTEVFRCADPECNHWMPPHLNEMLIGRASICWGCNKQFTLDADAMNEEMPRCFVCRYPESEDIISYDALDKFIQTGREQNKFEKPEGKDEIIMGDEKKAEKRDEELHKKLLEELK